MLDYIWNAVDPGFFAPGWLVAGLLAVIVLVVLEIRTQRLRRSLVRAFAASHLVASLVRDVSTPRRVVKAVLLIGATGLLFVALARPYLFYDWTDEARSGLDVLLAVDCSKSMLTEDVRPSRLERAKLAIADFADRLPADRLGLIAFAGDAFLECPLTLDHEAFLDAVRDLDTDTIPKPGTDIATAIDEASDALRSQPNNMKFLILISDGEDLEGRAVAAARAAAQNGLRIFTVGVGTAEGDHIPEHDGGGNFSYHHDESGNEVVSHLDESTLRQIAEVTGGAYTPLGQAGDGLEQIYQRYIGSLPRQNLEEKRQKIHIERFEWPLAAAIVLLMCEFLLSDRVRAAAPVAAEAAPRKPGRRRPVSAGTAVLLALLAVGGIFPLRADVATAERAYKSGDYDASMQDYAKAADADPARTELQFNRGDAAYKAGEFSEAEEAFRQALDTPNLKLQEQTYYNLGNTQYEHGAALLKLNSDKTVRLWQDALRSYERALKLKDSADTRHNYEVVKRKLEELKQQKQGGGQGSPQQGQGQSGDDDQPGGNPQDGKSSSGDSGDDRAQDGKSNGSPGQSQKATGDNSGKSGKQPQGPGSAGNRPMQTYSGQREEDMKDPGIKSRADAENLLDSLKDSERRVSARALSSSGMNEPPPSGKDW